MANMVGVWKLVPEETTGHEEFGKAMGMTDAEIKGSANIGYTFTLSRDGDVWHMKIDFDNGTTWIDLDFRMDVPFTYKGVDKETELTSLISLRDDHFIEKMTSVKSDVTTHWDVDTYRDGDYVITVQTKDGKTEVQRLRKV